MRGSLHHSRSYPSIVPRAPYSLHLCRSKLPLSPECNVASNDSGLFAAEVGDIVHNLLCVRVRHCLAEGLLALKVQDRSDAVLVVWGKLNDGEALQAVLCPGVLYERHVCGMVVVEVELRTILARVEDDRLSTLGGHCDFRFRGLYVYKL